MVSHLLDAGIHYGLEDRQLHALSEGVAFKPQAQFPRVSEVVRNSVHPRCVYLYVCVYVYINMYTCIYVPVHVLEAMYTYI